MLKRILASLSHLESKGFLKSGDLFQHLSILQAIRSKAVLSKYCESVLSKSAKIRGLVNDLQKNYEDEMAVKSNT